MNKELVARSLLRQRTSRRLTQERLAEQAGVTARAIQRIEAAGAAPHLTTLALLAGALDIPVRELAQEPAPEVTSVPVGQPAGLAAPGTAAGFLRSIPQHTATSSIPLPPARSGRTWPPTRISGLLRPACCSATAA